MKRLRNLVLVGVVAIGLAVDGLAGEKREFAHVSMSSPGSSKNPIGRDELILLVVEGPTISHEANVIPVSGTVDYVNNLLRAKNVSYIGVYTREGVKYGDVIRAIDTLRRTEAKNIGVSMAELPAGREL